MLPGHSLSEASEGDSVSEWGDDAAVYSSHSELSEWNASDADSVQDPEEALQVTDQTAPGEVPLDCACKIALGEPGRHTSCDCFRPSSYALLANQCRQPETVSCLMYCCRLR